MKFRLWLVFVIVPILAASFGCSPGIDKKKFEGAAKAAEAVQRAIDNQDDYLKSTELFGVFSNEVIALRDRVANEKERQLLKAYDDLFITYQDGFQLWDYKVESSRYSWIPAGRIYLEPKIMPLAKKYNLSVQSHVLQITKYEFKSVPADALNLIWERARLQFSRIKP
jgi:hypothetical protein